MPIQDSTAAIFTHIPDEIVKVWTPPNIDRGSACTFRKASLYLEFNDLAVGDTPPAPGASTGSRLEVWKESMRLFDDLDKSIESIITDHAVLLPLMLPSQKPQLATQTWMSPSQTASKRIRPVPTGPNSENSTSSKAQSSKKVSKRNH